MANAAASQAITDATSAFNFVAGQPCGTNLTGQDLGGLTLTPGVYCFNSSAQLTGTLTLNGQGNPNAVFIFQIGSTLTTASNSSVLLINSATACNVFFQAGSSATLGTGTQFNGSIFALASVTLTTNVNLSGRVVALNGAVTLDSNVVSVPVCRGTSNTGFVQICKVAGGGVAVGTNFTFSVAGTSVTIPAGTAPGGSCSTALVVPAGPTVITETLPGGITLAGVSTSPGGLLVSSNLATGTATVTVNAGGQTIVTFIDTVIPNPNTGFIQVCKVAGAGVAVGTNFAFNLAGTPVIIPAGPAPGGSCSAPLLVPAGPTVITETLPAGTALTSVSTLPGGLLVSSNLATGTATVTVNAGGQTIVTFIDTVIPPPNAGFVQVCKVAGAGVAVGTSFTFNVAGTPVTVPAGPAPGGSCSAPLLVPAGPTVITETLPAGITLAAVSTVPGGLLGSSNLAAGTATVTVNAGGQTIVTFIDVLSPPPPLAYLIRYLSNLNLGDSFINITNSGERGAGLAAGTSSNTTGAICANVYAFSPDEQMVSCCSCPVTPNGLVSLSARTDLINNTLTPAVPTSLVVKLVASVPGPGSFGCMGSAASVTPSNLAPGMAAWATTVHVGPSAGALGTTETAFLSATLTTAPGIAGGIGELARLTQLCTFINANGSGFGICRPCRLGALGAGRL